MVNDLASQFRQCGVFQSIATKRYADPGPSRRASKRLFRDCNERRIWCESCHTPVIEKTGNKAKGSRLARLLNECEDDQDSALALKGQG